MCHPALTDDTAGHIKDPIYANRVREYATFSDNQFLKLLQKYRIDLVRGSDLFKN
jgi:hypothetical protein